jgi:NAD(P)-dependent dehydrogenase (short-subunit alcohol dehydrogenase family)
MVEKIEKKEKFENPEKIELLEEIFKDSLNNINKNISVFFRYYRKNLKDNEKISEMIYTNPIFRNRKKLILLADIIKKTENHLKHKIKENKKKTEMYNMRIEEMNEVKNFIEKNKNEILNAENIKLIKDKEEIDSMNSMKDEDDNSDRNSKGSKGKKENNNMNYFRECYCCKINIVENNLHFFYSNLCKKCGDLNYSYRTVKLDLSGRIALVTGGRIKIGFEIAKKLLNYGCKVIVTTRFPKDALLKFKEDKEYDIWKNNLIIYPIDFRLFESTVKFVNYLLNTLPHLDILINNAAQTLRRPTSYYKYLLPIETQKFSDEEESKIIKNDYNSNRKELNDGGQSNNNSKSLISIYDNKNENKEQSIPISVLASQIKIMEEKEQPDKILMGSDKQPHEFTQGKNSWKLELDEVPFEEFMEVQIINAWTPYYLNCKLKPLMEKSPFTDKYIINVTAMEGVFNVFKKTTHPHTNMAKAALNMMTRTCGEYYKKFNIYMTAVDTGWVSSMGEMNNLFNGKENNNNFEELFCNVPLDCLDGAMRVLQPVIEGVKNKKYLYGIILKDYKEYHW